MAEEADIRVIELRRRLLGGYQLLQALVGIRLRSVTDPESRRHLTWLSDVVAALGLLNRRAAEDGPVDFADYLQDAANFWRRACEGRPIRFEVRAASAVLPEAQALSLAIIAHELLANATRHAFPEGHKGAVAIAFSRSSSGVSLVVRDSGVGAAAVVPGDGLTLVEGLVTHIGGSMAIETAAGAGVGVRIRLPLGEAPGH